MKIETLRTSSSSRGGRKQYWVDSAKRLGLVDTPHGIHFGRDPTGPLPPLDTSAQSFGPSDVDDSTTAAESSVAESPVKNGSVNAGSLLSQEHSDEMKRQKERKLALETMAIQEEARRMAEESEKAAARRALSKMNAEIEKREAEEK